MANTTPTPPAKPVVSIRYGNVSVAAFANEAKTKDGKTFEAYNVSVRRSYRKSDGEWINTHSLRRSDLLPAAEALTECFQRLSGSKDRLEVDSEDLPC